MDMYAPVNPTILVVDDAPANLSLISGLLRGLYTVKAVNHGAKALKIASEEPPDLILLDIMMPDMDGYEVCRRLKSDSQTRHIPIIFLTSKSDIESEQMGMSLGAVDYVTRPISPPILLSRVKAHLVDAFHARTPAAKNPKHNTDYCQQCDGIFHNTSEFWSSNDFIKSNPATRF